LLFASFFLKLALIYLCFPKKVTLVCYAISTSTNVPPSLVRMAVPARTSSTTIPVRASLALLAPIAKQTLTSAPQTLVAMELLVTMP
jgi:hypothetical protein